MNGARTQIARDRARTSEIMQELVTLAENAIDLLQTFEDYLA